MILAEWSGDVGDGTGNAFVAFGIVLACVFGLGWIAGASFTLWTRRRGSERDANGQTVPVRGNHNRTAKRRR